MHDESEVPERLQKSDYNKKASQDRRQKKTSTIQEQRGASEEHTHTLEPETKYCSHNKN